MDWMFATDDAYALSQWLFIRLMGGIYLIAFWSLYVQVPALFGSKGITPIHNLITQISLYTGKNRYYQIPTIFWINSSNRFLCLSAGFGIISSIMVIIGWLPVLFLVILWILYLSFHSAGSEFLSYQWDTLLLEVGFVSIFFAIETPPPAPIVFLLWFLLFRFMFSSGIVKYLHGSPDWRDLTAMQVHYETQPLPTKLSFYLHHQPFWFAKLTTLSVYFFEVFIPFLIFTPAHIRIFAFFSLVLFQIVIMLTGNYTFFNLLAIVMCVPLIPDSILSPFLGEPVLLEASPITTLLVTSVAYILLFLNLLSLAQTFVSIKFFRPINRFLIPFRLVNNYGLFVRMTQHRDEIIVEGSEDGENWQTYEFKWKPGDPTKAPKWNIPHQPRLDWQMWFASLSTYRHNQWFINFLTRLLEGSKEVEDLLKENPFKKIPPKYIRALFYRYHYSDIETKKKTGVWWTREYKGLYCPQIKKLD